MIHIATDILLYFSVWFKWFFVKLEKNMQSIGIICEYNPFHRGHQKQMRMIREAVGEDAAIICVMSGDFVQRGDPALYPASVRAKAAVLGGADLVLQLPLTYSLRSAEGFAAGGVEILSALGAVDQLCFGCESREGLMETAQALCSAEFSAALREQLDTGISFAAARQRALEAMGCDGSVIETPNNILAVEYCKAILRQGSSLVPMPVIREGGYHDELPDPENPSASSLRRTEDFLPYVPEETARCYEGKPQYRREYGEKAMLARLRTMTEEEFSRVPYGSEGLWSKVMRECRLGGSVEEILQGAKSKRYAYTRLSRLLMCAFLGITEELLEEKAPYVRILAMSGRGRSVLRRCKTSSSVQLLHAGERAPACRYADLESRAALCYDLFCSQPNYRNYRAEDTVFCAEKM